MNRPLETVAHTPSPQLHSLAQGALAAVLAARHTDAPARISHLDHAWSRLRLLAHATRPPQEPPMNPVAVLKSIAEEALEALAKTDLPAAIALAEKITALGYELRTDHHTGHTVLWHEDLHAPLLHPWPTPEARDIARRIHPPCR